MENKEIINDLIRLINDQAIFSKVSGNRNWAIRTKRFVDDKGEECKYAAVGRYGIMEDRHMLDASVNESIEYNIRKYIFTYKKDLEEMIKILKADGYNVYWIR